jgi:hypothetical protein
LPQVATTLRPILLMRLKLPKVMWPLASAGRALIGAESSSGWNGADTGR